MQEKLKNLLSFLNYNQLYKMTTKKKTLANFKIYDTIETITENEKQIINNYSKLFSFDFDTQNILKEKKIKFCKMSLYNECQSNLQDKLHNTLDLEM
jgi:hypothetical protein